MSAMPNLFIGGAPKSGTTSLARSLAQHPEIYLPVLKEPHFFGSETPCGVDDYPALFANGANCAVRIDASTHTLSSHDAAQQIAEALPEARFIALFRDPAETIPAFHGQLRKHAAEPVADFATAWAQRDARARGELPGHDYRRFFAYGSQVDRLMQHIPQTQLRLYPFSRLKQDGDGLLRDILDFLGLPDAKLEMLHENVRQEIRSDFAMRLKKRASLAARRAKLALGIDRNLGLGRKAFALASRPAEKTALDPALVAQIREEMAAEMALLEKLTGVTV